MTKRFKSIHPKTLAVVATIIWITLCRLPVRADQPKPFETDARKLPADTLTVTPWQTITIDEYGGNWVVAGDVDNDDEIEIVSARNFDENDNHFTSSVSVQKLDGSVLWRWGDSQLGRRPLHHDVACQIHDIDNNGANEVIVAADRQLIILNGRTGKVWKSFPIEQHAGDCVLFADLSGKGWPSDILVKNRYKQIWAYSTDGQRLWTVTEPGGYRTAHQPFPVDLDGDGRDEILAGYAALNADGSIRWTLQPEKGQKLGGHADCWRVVNLAPKPEDTRLILTMCGGNTLVLTDGNGQPIWRATGQHYESVDVGNIRPDLPGLELVVDIDHLPNPPKPLCLFDQQGNPLGRINTSYCRSHMLVDWNNDGLMEIGTFIPPSLYDGHGQPICRFVTAQGENPTLIAPVDLTGSGMRDVLLATAKNDTLKVYLYKNSNPSSSGKQPKHPTGTGPNFTLY